MHPAVSAVAPIVLVAAAIPAAYLLLLFVVAMCEKRLVQVYAPVAEDLMVILPPYVDAMSRDAAAAGFVWGGRVVHSKYPSVKILGTVWISPARETVVLAGSGTVLGMPSRQTWLFTPLSDGCYLVTTEQNDEGDSSGLYVVRRRLNARFPELLELHRRRLEESARDVRAFGEPTPFDALMGIYARRYETLVRRGRARWIGGRKEAWRYSALGALLVCLDFFRQLADATAQFWRVNAASPGEAVAPSHDYQVRTALGQAFPLYDPRFMGRQ